MINGAIQAPMGVGTGTMNPQGLGQDYSGAFDQATTMGQQSAPHGFAPDSMIQEIISGLHQQGFFTPPTGQQDPSQQGQSQQPPQGGFSSSSPSAFQQAVGTMKQGGF